MKIVTPKEIFVIEEMINQAKNKLLIKIKKDCVEISGTLFPKEGSLNLKIDNENANKVVSLLYKKGYVPFYIDVNSNTNEQTLYYIGNDANFMNFMRRIVLLFIFREVEKDDSKFEKIADLVMDYLGYIDIMFWYSKALYRKKKTLEMFEKMYLS